MPTIRTGLYLLLAVATFLITYTWARFELRGSGRSPGLSYLLLGIVWPFTWGLILVNLLAPRLFLNLQGRVASLVLSLTMRRAMRGR